jgi:hypothetical protein
MAGNAQRQAAALRTQVEEAPRRVVQTSILDTVTPTLNGNSSIWNSSELQSAKVRKLHARAAACDRAQHIGGNTERTPRTGTNTTWI